MVYRLRKYVKPFKEFIQSNVNSGATLIICVVLALIINNSPLQKEYHHFFSTILGISIGSLSFARDIHFWVNDGLMAIFFLQVGLEIKRELLEGELSNIKQSALPIIAALGGMIIPALIYSLINSNGEGSNGWGIPMATDIAFALAVLSLLGKKVPLSIKVFLTALAIVDDLGAIVVIAIFYTQNLALNYLVYAGGILIILYLLNIAGIVRLRFYIPFGIILWYLVYKSGIHATIAGVLFALFIPTNKGGSISSLERLEYLLHQPVAFIIMPLFALANTDIIFNAAQGQGLLHPVSIGIFVGLVLGKLIGIFGFSWLSIRFKIASMPNRANYSHLIGAALLGGVGFTMSIFISLLSFDTLALQNISKTSILLASVIAGSLGYFVLSRGKEVDETDESIEVRTH
jgi:NhaA family Na+:H+ antiporter